MTKTFSGEEFYKLFMKIYKTMKRSRSCDRLNCLGVYLFKITNLLLYDFA